MKPVNEMRRPVCKTLQCNGSIDQSDRKSNPDSISFARAVVTLGAGVDRESRVESRESEVFGRQGLVLT